LYLGEDLFELKTVQDLKAEEPAGVERPIVIDPITVKTQDLFRKYSKNLPRDKDGSFIVTPGKFVIGTTQEYVNLPKPSKIAARVEGRSTLARLGLIVHFTAPTIHASFRGHITLEMYNFGLIQRQPDLSRLS
jgi:dCTP deaminase